MGRKNTRYPEEFRNQIIKEVEEVGNATLVARKHDLVPDTITRWVRKSKKTNNTNYPVNIDYSTNSSLDKENEQLKKLLGEKDLEIAILKDLLKKTAQQ